MINQASFNDERRKHVNTEAPPISLDRSFAVQPGDSWTVDFTVRGRMKSVFVICEFERDSGGVPTAPVTVYPSDRVAQCPLSGGIVLPLEMGENEIRVGNPTTTVGMVRVVEI
jgi:hypothetical protein